MFESTQALYADLASALGVASLPADAQGSLSITVGEEDTVLLFAEDEYSVMLVVPVMGLPTALDYGRVLWLLQRNFYESPLAPFRIACDEGGGVLIWGRMPVEGLSGAQLAGLIEAVANEAALIREEIEVDA